MLAKREQIIEAKTVKFSMTEFEKAELLRKCEKRKIFTGTRAVQEDAKKLVTVDFTTATNVYIDPGNLKRLVKVILSEYQKMDPDDVRYKPVEKTINSIQAEMEYQAKLKAPMHNVSSSFSSLDESTTKKRPRDADDEEDTDQEKVLVVVHLSDRKPVDSNQKKFTKTVNVII